ncbi:Leader peptidase PppA [Planctomycetes bacterium Poly30]|uniref:Leader peptidase PppA n=1 Tax=Saltatorellus ferox TaxID=2528018 RepID=A0A518EWC2_9BACT|nr:Leader peptidase PppA [Planctomycetes bacterium Poly30]
MTTPFVALWADGPGSGAFLALPPMDTAFFGVIWSILGLFVGSFLNVCIYRFPEEDLSVFRPARSHCPKCDRQLTWSENIPVLSWLFQRAQCRGCKAPIHWRYPLVELLGCAVFYASWRMAPTGAYGVLIVSSVVLAGLIVATFVDFDRYEIPDQVSIGGMWAAPVASWLVPALHASGPVALSMAAGGQVDSVAALAECFAGMALGGGFLYAVGWIGSKLYGVDAMGFGDVKLMAAGGGFIGVKGVAAALIIAVVVASVFGILNMLRFYHVVRSRQRRRKTVNRGVMDAIRTARIFGRYLPFGPYLALGIGIVLLDWKDVLTLLPFGL